MISRYYPSAGGEHQSIAFTSIPDGTVCSCQSKQNIAAQRWYLPITDSSGNTILNTTLTGSSEAGGINIISGTFSHISMYQREKDGQVGVTS